MKDRKTGQAMIELICGLVGIVVIITMLLQVNLLSREHLITVISARSEVAEKMMNSGTLDSASYLANWESGADDHKYSEDDTKKSGDAGSFLATLIDGAAIEELEAMLSRANPNGPENRISDVASSSPSSVVGSFDVVKAQVESEPVELLPGVRRLVFNAEEFMFEHTVYMPWINNVLD